MKNTQNIIALIISCIVALFLFFQAFDWKTFILLLIPSVIILIVCIKNKENISTKIGFWATLLGGIIFAVLWSYALIQSGLNPDLDGWLVIGYMLLAGLVYAVCITLAGISYLIGLFIKE